MLRAKRKAAALRLRFAPVPSWPRDETVLLTEAEPPLALFLWQRVRDVRLWALAAPESRARLFTGCDAVESMVEEAGRAADDLTTPLRALAALVRYPEFVKGPDLCAACLALTEWAEASHMPETALHYAEAAALADPTSARAAALAGSACARQAADQRAEVWLTRAIRTARRTQDWEWHARSYIRLGQLLYELGHLTRARRAYLHARASAKWSGHYACAAKAHHDLLLVECAVGTYEAGERHARRALALYSSQFPRIPYLAHDFAYLLTCHAAYVDALAVLDAAQPFFVRPWERVAILGTIAKATAGTGQRERHAEAVADLLLLAPAAETHAAAALVLAAEGATILGEQERAQLLASRALELAERRHEREPIRRARAVLDGGDDHLAVPPAEDRVAPLRAQFMNRLHELRASGTDAGTGEELARFTMSGRA